MGSVWKASHVMLGHTVAIKFLHASVDARQEGRMRFEREAKLSARLGEASRHICRVTDFGVIGSGTPFVVMELLQGEELSARLKRERVLPLPLAVEIIVQLCRALGVAHESGVIHRDLKPANVFLCNSEEGQEVFVKLLDFGVAKAAIEHEDTQATRAGMIFGTPGYMSPEQIVADGDLDIRSDLWSVAVLAYRMAVGRTPFGSGSMAELGLRILTANPAPPSSLRSELPPSFDEWMKKALSKRREDRFSSAAELASALVAAAKGHDVEAALPEAPAEGRISGLEDSTYEPMYRSEAAPTMVVSRSRRTGLIAVGAVLVVAVVLLVALTRKAPRAEARRDAKSASSAASLVRAGAGDSQASSLPSASPQSPETGQRPGPEAGAPIVASAPAEPSPARSALPGAAVAISPRSAPRPRSSRTVRRSSGAVEKQATDLWNKKDEL